MRWVGGGFYVAPALPLAVVWRVLRHSVEYGGKPCCAQPLVLASEMPRSRQRSALASKCRCDACSP